MNADLEAQVNEMGPEYWAVVNRLLSPAPVAVTLSGVSAAGRWRRHLFPRVAYLVAACAVVALGLCFFASSPEPDDGPTYTVRFSPSSRVYTLAYSGDAAAVGEIVRSQRADGSWSNDFLTEQNAAVLRTAEAATGVDGAAISVAYRKAVRYLKSRGLRPLSAEELRQRGNVAMRTLGCG